MKATLLSLLLSVLMSGTVLAKATLTDSSATGYGESYQEALAAALFNAVNQVKGVTVNSEKQLRADLLKLVSSDETKTTAQIGVEEKIFTLSKGWVESYTVTSSKQPSGKDGNWAVTVKAKIPQQKSKIKDNNRDSIAVMPFRFTHDTFALEGSTTTSNGAQMSSRIRDRILSSLTQSQKFVVVNRDHGSEFTSEKALLSSDNVSPSEASRIGNVVGADFMVVGNIHKLDTKTETKTFYGASKTTAVDHIDLSYQVIEVSSQKVLWADTIKTSHTRTKDQETDDTLEVVASLVSNGVLDLLFPVKVLDVVSPTEFYLNQGSARISQGDKLALFTKGRTLTDPDTGIEIKIDGTKVATLEATTVNAKYTIAKLVDGDGSAVKKGDIVRAVIEDATSINDAKEVRATPGSSDAPVNW